MGGTEIIFRQPRTTSIGTWLLSIILAVISIKIDSVITAWISVYFYLIGLLAFFYSFTKYAVLNGDGITFYIGPIFRKIELNIKWDSIDTAEYAEIEKKWRTKLHGVDTGLYAPDQENAEGVLIKLNREIENVEILKKNIKLCEKLKLPNEKSFIYLSSDPRGGFKNFLSTMQSCANNTDFILAFQKANESFIYKYMDWFTGLLATTFLIWNAAR